MPPDPTDAPDAPLPERCPLCGDDLRAVARVEADPETGDCASLACRCRSCGRLLFPPGALERVTAWDMEHRARIIGQIRDIRARDPGSVLVMRAA